MNRIQSLKCGYLGILSTVIAASACAPANPAMDASVDVPNAMQADTFRADTFRPVVDTFRPPVDTFVPPVDDTFVPPADTFVPPVDDTFVPPVDVPNADVPNADVPNFDVPNFDVPNVDVPNVDAPNAADAAVDVPPAPGCGLMVEPGALAIPAVGMTTTVMTTLNAMGMGGTNASMTCQDMAGGSERIFRLTLAAQTTIVLSATAMNVGTDTILAIRRNCASTATEVACNDDIGGGNFNSSLRATLPAGDYFVILDEFGPAAEATGGPVTLTLQTVTLAANAVCAMATPLTAGMGVMGNTNNGNSIVPNMCEPINTGTQLYYSFVIPANSAGTFAVVPSGMPAWAPFVRVFNSCASQDACTATNLAPMAGGTATAIVRNNGMMPQTVFVTVGSTQMANGGAFTITANSAMIPAGAYTMTQSAMAACDDIGMVARDMAVIGDDAASVFAPMPFAFSYHRAAVTHFSVSTNGLAQLGNAVGPGDTNYINLALPSGMAPRGALAVFWDDLSVGADPQGVRVQVLGAMPNRRFVIDWTNTNLGIANALHFQAKLFETTNVIEYHYCAMTGPMGNVLHTGSAATIGLQSVDTVAGTTFANNLANAIGAGSMPVTNMIRWTPAP